MPISFAMRIASRVHPTWAWLLLVMVCVAAVAADGPRRYLDRSDAWFASDEARSMAANILAHQSPLGGWPKNFDSTAAAPPQQNLQPTFDNGATTDELRFLGRIYDATQRTPYQVAFERGLDYILRSQYPHGGWPQHFPPGSDYRRHITFNDNAMVRLMEFLREVYSSSVYDFVDADRREASRRAFDRGIDCVLACQVVVDGQLTVWCAQHDEQDFSPRPARSFELASLSGGESVEIVRLLMSLDDPSSRVVQAIESAIDWFDNSRISGIRQVIEPDERSPKGTNKVIVKDETAPPLWARFYEIGTNRPIFVDRDGVPKYNLADIGYERRNGYSWLTGRPQRLLQDDYPAWKAKWTTDSSP